MTETKPISNLCAALAAAQKKCRAVAHDAKNEFHRYRYTSSEAIIEEAKQAFADTGLALLPLGPQLTKFGEQLTLTRSLLLMHTSGETIPLVIEHWPVIPDKGRPLDKAFASAITTSLAYFLRDLLQMPRCDPEDDISGREDRPKEKKAEKPPVNNTSPEVADKIQPWVDWLKKMPDIDAVNSTLEDLATLEGPHKKAAWERIKAYCAGYNWVWDKTDKKFVIQEGATL